MGNKMALIISFFFSIFVFLFGGDLIGIEMVYSNLDAVSISVGYMISKKGKIVDSIKEYVAEEAGAILISLNEKSESTKVGDIYKYQISKDYKPFLIKPNPMTIKVTRSVIIGQY